MVTSYPVVGKRKSFDICQAFLQGCSDKSQDAAVFYGVNETNANVWRSVREKKRTYYYIDNSYFDETRGGYYRVAKNAIQCRADGAATTFARLRTVFGGELPEVKPWKDPDAPGHIVVCPQSDSFMELIAEYRNWLRDTLQDCGKLLPDHPVVMRAWSPDKLQLQKSLRQDLQQAVRLFTHTSAAAVTAIMEGVHIHVHQMHALSNIRIGNDRLIALGVLADNQWTLDEIREGKAWKWLNQ